MPSRADWTFLLYRIAHPVLHALANRRLKATMPVEVAHPRPREHVSHLEAVGRLLAGIAPWLAAPGLDGDEAARRDELWSLALAGLREATDPAAPDYLNFNQDRQPLVDAAFLAHGLLRAPDALWTPLDEQTQANVIAALKLTRAIMPNYNNWLLFSAMVEAFLHVATGEGDLLRMDYALRQHESWYLGDGAYGDGPHLHWDYYNSYVILPMLLDILGAVAGERAEWDAMAPRVLARAQRYAQVQERMFAPDGSFPPLGRSITYRAGAFQLLAQLALMEALPTSLQPAAVRGALRAVIRRTLEPDGTFDADGWLTIGLAGHQPSLAEPYISTGSLYLCACGFLPLGLAPDRPFWADPDAPWTSQRIWGGEDMPPDKASDGVMKSDYQ